MSRYSTNNQNFVECQMNCNFSSVNLSTRYSFDDEMYALVIGYYWQANVSAFLDKKNNLFLQVKALQGSIYKCHRIIVCAYLEVQVVPVLQPRQFP